MFDYYIISAIEIHKLYHILALNSRKNIAVTSSSQKEINLQEIQFKRIQVPKFSVLINWMAY